MYPETMPPIVSAIIPAAGKGQRLPGELPKQFRLLGAMPLLVWSIKALVAVADSGPDQVTPQ